MLKTDTYIINDIELFNKLVAYASKVQSEYLVFDAETDSEIEKKANLYGLGLCLNEHKAFYIAWRTKDGELVWSEAEQALITEWLLSIAKTKKLIGHNAIYDILVIENNLGIDLTDYLYSDTILLQHTVAEEGPFALKELAVERLGPEADRAQQELKASVIANGGKWLKSNKQMFKAETMILGNYCCWDVYLTLKLFYLLDKQVQEENLADLFYTKEVMPLYKYCTIPMKRHGFPVDLVHFNRLKVEITNELDALEQEIVEEVQEEVKPFTDTILDKHVPFKPSRALAEAIAAELLIPLPTNKKTNKITLGKKDITRQLENTPEYANFYKWLLGEEVLTSSASMIEEVRTRLCLEKLESKYLFNLNSSAHLGYYFFDVKGYEPLKITDKGKSKLDIEFLNNIKGTGSVQKIIDYKKLQKLLSTYVEGILSRQIDGVIYTSMLQFGTTSGRYSSRNPNLQNMPRVKDDESGLSPLVLKYVNQIRKGLFAGPGKKVVDADYSSLEPVCFGHMSEEPGLRDIFISGKDLYSQVAIDVNKLNGVYSSDKKAANFLKKHKPELRQLWKVPTLGIVYGMEEARLMQSIGCTRPEAAAIIKGYLNTYPNLRKYMAECDKSAKLKGYVETIFGRRRHLSKAKAYYDRYGDELLDYRWAKSRSLLERA
jgi:DNA polymerase I-like protein with 3'-5' exonuclease and polymerase domains